MNGPSYTTMRRNRAVKEEDEGVLRKGRVQENNKCEGAGANRAKGTTVWDMGERWG